MILTFITGLLGGAIPKLLNIWSASQDHKREMQMLRLQTELQLLIADKQMDAQLMTAESGLIAEQMRAQTQQLKAIYKGAPKSGLVWIDALNAAIRPVTALLLVALFVFVAVLFVVEVMAQVNQGLINATALPNIIFHGVIGEAFTGVLGFLFGYRTTMQRTRRMGEQLPWLR